MWNYQANTMRPDGYGVLNNDADLIYNRERIKRAADIFKRKDWLYIATNGKEGTKPKGQPSVFFPYAGQLTMRSGYEPNAHWAFFDIGPWGTGHQHNDKLHVSVYAFGSDLLVDGGRFAYRGAMADKFRKYATGSHSHNVILIDGKGQADGPRLTDESLTDKNFKRTPEYDHTWSSFDRFDGIDGICTHTRLVFNVRGKFWIIADRITTDCPRKVETLWHWHPECVVSTKMANAISGGSNKGNLAIIPAGKVKWNITRVKGQEIPSPQGWYSREYNFAEPAETDIFSATIGQSYTFVWILYPFVNQSPVINAIVTSENENNIKIKVKVKGEGRWEIMNPFTNSGGAILNLK